DDYVSLVSIALSARRHQLLVLTQKVDTSMVNDFLEVCVTYIGAAVMVTFGLFLCSETPGSSGHGILNKDYEEDPPTRTVRDADVSLHETDSLHSTVTSATTSVKEKTDTDRKSSSKSHVTERELALMIFNPDL
ncbi:hypothetical protein GCK32_012428, partial [Trichostrongylus colubriformis]